MEILHYKKIPCSMGEGQWGYLIFTKTRVHQLTEKTEPTSTATQLHTPLGGKIMYAHCHSHKEAKKVHRFLKETAGAKHNNLKWWQRTEYNYVSHVDTAKIWQKHLFLKQNEHGSPGYRNFLNGLPASSSCMCCNIETLKSKKQVELHLIWLS